MDHVHYASDGYRYCGPAVTAYGTLDEMAVDRHDAGDVAERDDSTWASPPLGDPALCEPR